MVGHTREDEMETYVVNARWDDEAKVWIATSDDVPGLCCEAATLEALIEVVLGLAPDLLVENGLIEPDAREAIPVNVIAERHATAFLAA